MRPCQTILVLDDVRQSVVRPLYRKGVELSSNDNQTVMDVYQQWLLLMIDLGYLHPGTLYREALRLWSNMATRDVLDLNNAFAELLNCVRIQKIKGFKALCSKISPHFYHYVKEDMKKVLASDVYAARRLVQLFSYTSRLSLTDIDLTQQCLDEYVEIESAIDSTRYPRLIVRSLNKTIQKWMKSFDPTRIQCQHGPRGVAGHGRTSLEVKYKDLTFDPRLTYAFGEPNWCVGPVLSSLDRISHTIFVPKSYKTFRTISMESSTLQYFQQGVWREIERVVLGSHWLRSHIGFSDQTRNKMLAKEGSISRQYATIDLSAASDSVSYALVKELFRGTKLLRFLVATRSTKSLLPDGRLIALKKFAPMGSALCFPIETMIFAAICEFVTREHGVTEKYSVFGDDIIVPTQCVEDTVHILEVLGFRVNREKSFYRPDTWFRESCGGEYCDGFDVTPVRVSRKYAHNERDVRIKKCIDLSNSAYKRGLRHLRQFFIRRLRQHRYVPLFGSTSILADNYTNYHTKRRWNLRLHRIEARVSDLKTSYKEGGDESIRLRHWLEATHNRTSIGDGFQSMITRSDVFIQDYWRTKEYEPSDQRFIDFFTQ